MPLVTAYNAKNNIIGLTLASPYVAGSGSMVLTAGGADFTAFPAKFTIATALSYGTGALEVNGIYSCTGVSSNTLTGVAAVEGTVDGPWAAGSIIDGRPTAGDLADLHTVVAPLNAPGAVGTALVSTGPTTAPAWSSVSTLAPVAVKTANFTALANQLVPVDTTSGAVTVTLPTAPADKTQVVVKLVVQGAGNNATVACGGADTFNKAAGTTSSVLSNPNQSIYLQYAAANGVWYVLAADQSPMTINFSSLTGTLAAAQIPDPSASTLGGVQSAVAVNHEFMTGISTAGVPLQAQPAFGDLSGSISSGQLPGVGSRSWVLGAGTPLVTGTNVTPNTAIIQGSGSFARVDMCVGTSNTGNIPTGSSIIIDILQSSNGGSTWVSLWAGSPGSRPSIAAGAVQGNVTSFVNASHAAGNLLRIDVIQVGSTNPGSNLMVELI